MIKVYAENGYVSIEQDEAGTVSLIVLSYAETEKLREELIRAQIKIKDACKVSFVKE
jgi:hypothetical protein